MIICEAVLQAICPVACFAVHARMEGSIDKGLAGYFRALLLMI